MSIARHHAEWLSLLEISGPFLSLPVLLRAFPQGLDAHDPELARDLRLAYEEWLDNQGGSRPDPAIHRAWIEWVLLQVLGMPAKALHGLQSGVVDDVQASCDKLAETTVPVPEHGERLRPDIALYGRPAAAKDGTGPVARLLVQIVPAGQDLEKPLRNRRWLASPATRMMTLLHGTGVRLGLVTNGEQWMLVDAPKGETTGYISWYAELWLEEQLTLRAFRSLLGVQRFFGVAETETIERLLANSANNQQEVTDQLGYQVRRAVEVLVQAIDVADQDRGRALLQDVTPEHLYEAAVTVMMRLVFLFSAEERGMLLLGDPVYDQHYAVSTLLAQLRETADEVGEEVLERRHDAWCRLLATFRAVHGGIQHDQLVLPGYGGSLFDPDRFAFLEGRLPGSEWRHQSADPLQINNRTVLHLMEALQMLQVRLPGGGPAEARRLSFRALDIEQIGHVYEGLLDHTAVRASEPVLGLVGTREQEPELTLSNLEQWQSKGEDTLLKNLKDQTRRSPNALHNALQAKPDFVEAQRLQAVCGGDDNLYSRVLPFAGLVRDDPYGHPTVIHSGSVYVTVGKERRATGTHYTPRSLTEPIVQHTLEPLVYEGPAEGRPQEEWRLRSAAELLELKVCDMAMGSGAFLVQTCRYLSERLVEAWSAVEEEGGTKRLVNGLGEMTDNPDESIPADTVERLAVARRLVTDRCLYGVDKNPLAVEMAKLSLWLITLDKGRPFTFLDHALRCGDSLVGADLDQLQVWSLERKATAQLSWFTEPVKRAIRTALDLRRRIAATPVRDLRDTAAKAHLLAEAEEAMAIVRLGADLLVAGYLGSDPKPREARRQDLLAEFYLQVTTLEELQAGRFTKRGAAESRTGISRLRNEADVLLHGLRPFHWFLEYPEVFESALSSIQRGFRAVIGNPPFLGGRYISGQMGSSYLSYLKTQLAPGVKGNADIIAYFYLQAFEILIGRRHGRASWDEDHRRRRYP